MILHIAKKEVLEHLKSFRFAVAFLFIVATFFIMMFTRHFEYSSQYDDYLLRVKQQQEALDRHGTYASGIPAAIVPPSPMEVIVDPAVTSTLMKSGRSLDDDPLKTVNIDLDLIALVGLLGSLLALLLSYDAINREVNEGTMRLLLSTGVPRIKIILGKILGGSLAVTLPIIVIFILTSIWLAISGGLGFGINQWVSLLGIFLVSVIYIMFFYCLGTFLSSIILDHTLSSLSCFAIWILLVIVIPLISPNIARSIVKVPDLAAMNRQIMYINNVERLKAIQELARPIMAREGISWDEANQKINPEERMRVFQIYNDRVIALQENFKNAALRQTKLSIRLACVSPYSPYLAAVEELSGLGFERFEYLDNVTGNWQQKAREYLTQQYFEDRKRKGNPEFYSSLEKLDLSNMPTLQYAEPALPDKYSNALPYILLLSAFFSLPLLLILFTFNSKKTLL